MKRYIPAMSIAAVILCIGIFVPARGSGAEAPEKVRIAFSTMTLPVAPWWIARDKGYFADEGIDGEITYIRGAGTIVQAMIGGNIQVAYIGAPPIAAAAASGAALTVVAVPINRMDYVIVTRQRGADAGWLKGKRFAISRIGDSSEIATRVSLERMGIDPGAVKMMSIGGSPDRIAALRSGNVDAAILSATEVIGLENSEFHTVFDLAKAGIEYPFDVLSVTKTYAAQKRRTVLGVIRAFIRGVKFLRTNKQETLQISARWLRNPNTKSLERQWQHVAFDLYQLAPYPTEAGFTLALRGMAQVSPKVGELRMADIVDPSFLDELKRTNLFDETR
ncbi:MAG TPA: ABC transporter substrate-binding protein [Candidatus Binatia bacterium]